MVRVDAVFAMPALDEALERPGGYAIRLAANAVLERQIGDLLTRRRGRPRRLLPSAPRAAVALFRKIVV